MIDTLYYIVESIIGLGMFWLFYKWIIEKENLLNFSRFYLLITPALSLLFPLIKFYIPASFLSLNRVSDEFIIQLNQVIISAEGESYALLFVSWPALITWAYLSGISVTAVILLVKLINLFLFIRKHPIERTGKYNLILVRKEFPSFSFLHYIFIGNIAQLPESDRIRIIEHEKVHVDQKHSYDILYFEILSILFWFNPFIWLYKKLLVDNHEFLADKTVIKRTGPEGYAHLLVRQAIGYDYMHPASYFKNSTILKRICKMKTYNKRSNKLIVAMFLPVVLAVFFLISCSEHQMISEKTVPDSGSSDPSSNTDNLQGDLDVSVIPIDTVTNEVVAQVTVRPEFGKNSYELTVGARFDTVTNQVFDEVDVMPVFEGGYDKFFALIRENMKYPAKAKNEGIQGQVLVNFIVDKEGNLRNITVVKGLDPECDREAVRVVSLSPRWKPGIKDGQPVAVKMILPILYRLDSKK